MNFPKADVTPPDSGNGFYFRTLQPPQNVRCRSWGGRSPSTAPDMSLKIDLGRYTTWWPILWPTLEEKKMLQITHRSRYETVIVY